MGDVLTCRTDDRFKREWTFQTVRAESLQITGFQVRNQASNLVSDCVHNGEFFFQITIVIMQPLHEKILISRQKCRCVKS